MSTDHTQKPPSKNPSNGIRNMLDLIGWTGTPEQEQAALRIAIPLSFISYLILNKPAIENEILLWSKGIWFILPFLGFAIILLTSSLIWSQASTIRKIIGVFGDIGALSYGLYLTGEMGAPWFGVYLWVTLGNGFRYGEKYLYLSTTVSLIGFACVAILTPFWATHTGLAVGITFTLLLIPGYSAILIRRLNEARKNADDANRAKSDFLSCMSHEIRTPLNGILGMTELLKLRPLEPEDKECVDTIHASGQTLACQINEILDLSKIEAGQLALEQIEFDLYVLINTTLRIFHPQTNEKQLQLHEIIDPQTPFLLTGDPHKLQQIIINLVGNAIKFTEQGMISLRIYPRSIDTDQAVLRFEVADTGTGIPADRLQAIFEPFTQADSSVSRSYGGTGLGTTICKNLVELMGGQIGVHSTPGVGTTFWFDIPFASESREATEPDQVWTSQCEVLYLNPQGDTQEGIPVSLKEWNIPFKTATTLDQAAKLLVSQHGYAALIIENIPYDQRLAEIITDKEAGFSDGAKIILVNTGQYPANISENSHDQVVVLEPPHEQNILFNVLHACYSRHSSEDDVIHFSHKQVNEQQTNKSLHILVSDDSATNRIVLQRMLEKLGHRYTTVTGGESLLTSLEDNLYDVVIADKNMPDLGGVEAYQAYCFAHGGNPPVPFIILTADATDEARESCKSAGIDLFLTKPISLVKLQETLSFINAADTDTMDNTEPGDASLNSEREDLPVLNEDELDKLGELTDGDNNFVIELIGNFETDARNDLRGLESAVAGHNWAAFRDHAHALKGCALYLGLTRLAHLSRIAQDIDQDEFDKDGILHVQTINRATNDAIRSLQDKLTTLGKKTIPN